MGISDNVEIKIHV